jgi:ABC-type sugar transport system permease subunit
MVTTGRSGVPQNISMQLLDGANSLVTFCTLLPLLRPAPFLIVTNTIGALQVFDSAFATTTGCRNQRRWFSRRTHGVVLTRTRPFKFFRMGRACYGYDPS